MAFAAVILSKKKQSFWTEFRCGALSSVETGHLAGGKETTPQGFEMFRSLLRRRHRAMAGVHENQFERACHAPIRIAQHWKLR